MKCECLPREEQRNPAVHPLPLALHHLLDKCNIIRKEKKGRKKEGGGGGKVAILQANG